jgi:hypothetical protein
MSPTTEFNDLFAANTTLGNDGDVSGVAQPVTEGEIDELLYSEEWTVEERIARLEALRSDLQEMEAASTDRSDRNALFTRIDDALIQLRSDRGGDLNPTSSDGDPIAHRETMSPDDDELIDLESIEQEEDEEGDLDTVLDESEWDEDDGFDPDKGTR